MLEVKKCIFCGRPLAGRTDKKFCSLSCKNAYHNERQGRIRNYRNRIITSMNGNYRILEQLVSENRNSAALCDIEPLGFKPAIVTGYEKSSPGKVECRCFDIKYCQNQYRIYKIERIEMT